MKPGFMTKKHMDKDICGNVRNRKAEIPFIFSYLFSCKYYVCLIFRGGGYEGVFIDLVDHCGHVDYVW